MRLAIAIVACALTACADAPSMRAPVITGPVFVGPVSIVYMSQERATAECERRIGNGVPHWGCATYSARGCEVIVGDVDRSAVLGAEITNCARMASGRLP
jgi:hypothetical protein